MLEKENIKSKLFIDSLIVNAASFVEKAGFFIANIIIARYLSLEHFGEYSTALAYATFFSLMTDIGINVTLIRALNLEYTFANEHFTNAFIIKISLAVVMYALMAGSLFFTDYNRDVIYLTLIFGAVRIGNEFMRTFYSVDEARQNFLFPSLMNSGYVAVFLAAIIAVVVWKGNYYHLAYVRLGIVCLFIVLLSYRIFNTFSFVFSRKLCRKFISSAIPFSVSAVLWNLILRTNAIIISMMIGTTKVGIFTSSMLFLDTLSIIPTNLRKITLPVLYKALEENKREKFQFSFDIMTKYFGIVSFYLMVILILFAKDIIVLIFGTKYLDSVPVLQLLSFSIPFIFNIAGIIIVGLDKQSVLSHMLIVTTVVNIVANIILIHFFDLSGAAIAIVITYGLIFILGHLYLMVWEKLKMMSAVIWYVWCMIISAASIGVMFYTPIKNCHVLIAFPIVSLTYVLLVIAFVLKKDDIRIIREMIQL